MYIIGRCLSPTIGWYYARQKGLTRSGYVNDFKSLLSKPMKRNVKGGTTIAPLAFIKGFE